MVHIVPHTTELGISAIGAANIIVAMSGVSVVGKVLLGRASDTMGCKQIYTIGVSLMLVALLWLVPAGTMWKFYLFAAFFGLGYGGCASTISPLVAVLFGLGSHGLIFGVITFLFRLGGGVGPFLSGYIFDVTGSYQLAFWVCSGISLTAFILASVLKPIKMKNL